MVGGFQQLGNGSQCLFAISQDSNIGLYILIYFGRVNIKVDNLRLLGICFQFTRHTVIKAHAYGDKDITFIGIDIGPQVTVHTKHSFVQRMVRRQCGKSQ